MSKIRFIEDAGIKEYDTDIDALIIQKKLEKIANEIKIPAFHKGNLDPEFLSFDDFKVSDSLQFTIERHRYDSQGSGTFVSGNLADILDWTNNYKSDSSSDSLYLIDLGKYSDKLLNLESDDISDKYSEFLEKISSYIMMEITGESSKYLPEGVDTAEKLYEHCKKPMKYFKVDKDSFLEWTKEEVDRVREAIFNDTCDCEHSINTSFQMKCMNIGGINLSRAAFDDSIARGSIIFDIDKEKPFLVDFGTEDGLARDFFSKIYTKVLTPKMKKINEEDVKPLLYNYQEALPFAADSEGFERLNNTMSATCKGFITAKYLKTIADAYKINVDSGKLERAVLDKILSVKDADAWKKEIERQLEEMYGIDIGSIGFVNKFDDPFVKEAIEDWLEDELKMDVGKMGFRDVNDDRRTWNDGDER